MDVVAVDSGKPLIGFVMKENRGVWKINHVSHFNNSHLEIKNNLVCRLGIVKEPLNVSS